MLFIFVFIKIFDEFGFLAHPKIFPASPLLLYPVNHTFSITCSLLCNSDMNSNGINWFMNEELLNNDNQDFNIETISPNTQRLTVYLNKNFIQANYTCKYDEKEATILVRRRTSEWNSRFYMNNVIK